MGIVLTAVLLLGIFYSRYQRVWIWDEEFNYLASRIVANRGVEIFLKLYGDIPWLGNRHPPLIILLNGAAIRVLGGGIFTIRMVSLAFGLGTIWLTFLLGRTLFDAKTGLIASVLLLSFPLVIRLSTAALNDIQVTFFFTLAILISVKIMDSPSWSRALALGLVIGAGLLMKYTMLSFYLVLVSFVAINKRLRSRFWPLAAAVMISLVIFALWVVVAVSYDATVPGVPTALLFPETEPSGYVAPDPVMENTEIAINPGWFVLTREGLLIMLNILGTRLTSAIGLYNLPVIAIAVLMLLRRREPYDFLLLLWIIMISVFLIITLPDHRYFMPTFPALALMMALVLLRNPRLLDRVLLLVLLYNLGALYLFIDWFREAELFVR
jgi:4-amino-4-deoxy-L-arabinose transferase-like glycosyltransferase